MVIFKNLSIEFGQVNLHAYIMHQIKLTRKVISVASLFFLICILITSIVLIRYQQSLQSDATENVSSFGQSISFTDPLTTNSFLVSDTLAPQVFQNQFSIELWTQIIPENGKDSYTLLTYAPKDRYIARTFDLGVYRQIENFDLAFTIQKSFDNFSSVKFTIPNDWVTNRKWFHVGISVNGTNAAMYINGLLVDETQIESVYIAENPILISGGIVRDGYLEIPSAMKGSMDDLRVSSIVRGFSQLWATNTYREPLSVDENTVALWHFDGSLVDTTGRYNFSDPSTATSFTTGAEFIAATPTVSPTVLPSLSPSPTILPSPTATASTTPVPSPSTPSILKSEYFKNDVTANEIVNLTAPYRYFPEYKTSDPFDNKLSSAFRMLGYSFGLKNGVNLSQWGKAFQKQHKIFEINIITREFIIAIDDEIFKHEQKIKPWADKFPVDSDLQDIDGYGVIYMPIDPTEPPKDHIRYYFAYLLSQLPAKYVPMTENNMTDFLRSQSFGVLNYDQNQNKFILDFAGGVIYQRNKAYPSDLYSIAAMIHEYAHTMEKQSGQNKPRETVDFKGLLGMAFDLNNCNSLWQYYCKRKPNFNHITNYSLGVEHFGEQYSMHEMDAEAVSMYVLQGKLFRKMTTLNNDYKQMYEWLKINVFDGKEYCTGSEQLIKNSVGNTWDYTLEVPIPAGSTPEIMQAYLKRDLADNEANPGMAIDEYLKEGEFYPNCAGETPPTPVPTPTPSPTPTPQPTCQQLVDQQQLYGSSYQKTGGGYQTFTSGKTAKLSAIQLPYSIVPFFPAPLKISIKEGDFNDNNEWISTSLTKTSNLMVAAGTIYWYAGDFTSKDFILEAGKKYTIHLEGGKQDIHVISHNDKDYYPGGNYFDFSGVPIRDKDLMFKVTSTNMSCLNSIRGDADLNGKIMAFDAAKVAQHLAGQSILSGQGLENGKKAAYPYTVLSNTDAQAIAYCVTKNADPLNCYNGFVPAPSQPSPTPMPSPTITPSPTLTKLTTLLQSPTPVPSSISAPKPVESQKKKNLAPIISGNLKSTIILKRYGILFSTIRAIDPDQDPTTISISGFPATISTRCIRNNKTNPQCIIAGYFNKKGIYLVTIQAKDSAKNITTQKHVINIQ